MKAESSIDGAQITAYGFQEAPSVQSLGTVQIPAAPTNDVEVGREGGFSPIAASSAEIQKAHVINGVHNLQRLPLEASGRQASAAYAKERSHRKPLSIVLGGIQREPPLFVRRRPPILAKDDEKEKEAAITALELSIMGSALVLTLGLQVQEVVGSRGGFADSNRDAQVRFMFVGASALSFALSFYSIVTAAVMLLSIVSTPSM